MITVPSEFPVTFCTSQPILTKLDMSAMPLGATPASYFIIFYIQ
jgi:hypothetical protein